MNDRHRAPLLALAALTAAALLVRLAVLPGVLDSDSLYFSELVIGSREFSGETRDLRIAFQALLRAGLTVARGDVRGLALAPALLGAAAVPVTWLATRRTLGRRRALLAAAVLGALPMVLEETSMPSADGVLVFFGASLLWALQGALHADPAHRRRALLMTGAVVGTGFVVKELFAFTALPAGVWLVSHAVRGRLRWRDLAWAALPAVVAVAADHGLSALETTGGRLAAVSARMADVATRREIGAQRLLLGPIPAFLTNAHNWGAFWLAAGPATALAFVTPARRAAATTLATGAVLAVWFLPVSLASYALLPDSQPRYFAAAAPAMVAVAFEAVRARGGGTWVRGAALAAAVYLGWRFGRDPCATAATCAAGWALSGLPPFARRRRGIVVFGTALLAATIPPYTPAAAALRWAFVLPLGAALLPGLRRHTGRFAAAAVLVLIVAMHLSDGVRRRRVRVQRSLPARVEGAGRVFAFSPLHRAIGVFRPQGPADDLRLWSPEDVRAARLPHGAAAGDVLICNTWDAPARVLGLPPGLAVTREVVDHLVLLRLGGVE